MGHFFCLAADDGEILWSRNYSHDYGWRPNTWGVSAAPLVDSEKVILLVGGADGAGVVALERNTGKEIWRALELDDPGYCPPVIIEAGGTRQLIQWTPKFLASLDIESGAVHWREPFDVQSSLTVPTPIFDAATHRLFVTSFYNGPMMLELDRERPAAKVLWRGKSQSEQNTDILHSIISTPVLTESHIYGVDSYGMLRCIEAKSGRRVWESLEATGEDRWWTAFLIPHGDRYLVANEQGELITVRLTPEGYEETSRAQLIEPTNPVRRRKVVWSHPAFANRSVYARNDREIVCASLAAGE
jgi:outer membrane protein assembly factor BamB